MRDRKAMPHHRRINCYRPVFNISITAQLKKFSLGCLMALFAMWPRFEECIVFPKDYDEPPKYDVNEKYFDRTYNLPPSKATVIIYKCGWPFPVYYFYNMRGYLGEGFFLPFPYCVDTVNWDHVITNVIIFVLAVYVMGVVIRAFHHGQNGKIQCKETANPTQIDSGSTPQDEKKPSQ